jgi:crossover junction endodeoxyribonuclease RuvC
LRILGVDPGLRVTGYAVIGVEDADRAAADVELIEAGVVRTPGPAEGIAARLRKIHDSLSELILELAPDVLVIEKLYAHYEHPTTAILMGHVRGVVCLLSGLHGVPLASMASTHVKKAITGRGHASKEQVQRMVQQTLSLKKMPEPADVADALAIALAWAASRKMQRVPSSVRAVAVAPRLRKVAV